MREKLKYMPRFVKDARLNAMLDGVSKGITSGVELQKRADQAARNETDKISRQSVRKFESLTSKIPGVMGLREPTKTEDYELQTDKWVLLENRVGGRKLLRLQIKSSTSGVDEFKKSLDFQRDPTLLVVNSRKTRKDKEIINDFLKEMQRVEALLASKKT